MQFDLQAAQLSLGAVGAAIIAALVALVGMIIAKENKTSEFRQAWIDALRSEIAEAIGAIVQVSYLAGIDDPKHAEKEIVSVIGRAASLLASIELRLNLKEPDHVAMRDKIREIEKLLEHLDGGDFPGKELNLVQDEVTAISQRVLKAEWDRVKQGEPVFQLTKWVLVAVLVVAVVFAAVRILSP